MRQHAAAEAPQLGSDYGGHPPAHAGERVAWVGLCVWEWDGFCGEMYRNSYRIFRFYHKSFTFHPKSHTQDPPIWLRHGGVNASVIFLSMSDAFVPNGSIYMRGVWVWNCIGDCSEIIGF